MAIDQGIVPGHAYTLLSAAKVKGKDGDEVKLVKLRNPWGSGEWTGDWSDESDLWTPELKKKLGLTTADDGIFWMEYSEFKEIFERWNVNKILDNAQFSYIEMKANYRTSSEFRERYKNPGYHLTRCKVNKEGMHTFAVSQMGDRLLPRRSEGKYLYASVVLYLFEGPEEFSYSY